MNFILYIGLFNLHFWGWLNKNCKVGGVSGSSMNTKCGPYPWAADLSSARPACFYGRGRENNKFYLCCKGSKGGGSYHRKISLALNARRTKPSVKQGKVCCYGVLESRRGPRLVTENIKN